MRISALRGGMACVLALSGGGIGLGAVWAGSLDAPGLPAAGSGMPSLADLYNRLSSGAAFSIPGTFREPASGPGTATGRSLSEIAARLPAPDNTNGASPADVAAGKTFWGLRTDGSWGPSTGTHAAAAANTLPRAQAGTDQSIKTGTTATLDGSASSDADSDPLSYLWTLIYRPVGSGAALSSAVVAQPRLTPDVSGPYVLSLVVNDGKADSAAATVVVTAAAYPVVTATSPAAGATEVGLQATISVTFDLPLQASSVNVGTFTVSDGSSNIAGTVSYSGNTATFSPSSVLVAGKTYTATLSTGVVGSSGDALASAYTWTFATIPRYVAVAGGCVYDNNTSLLWENKTADGGLRDGGNTYTHYIAPDSGSYWTESGWAPLTNAQLYAADNSLGFLQAVNASTLCGHSDWRIPTQAELVTLWNDGSSRPTIDTTWFPNTRADVYWSSTADPGGDPTKSGYVWFYNRYTGSLGRPWKGYVRLVRSGL